jgi:F-type H+-transporting ATPase subunit a
MAQQPAIDPMHQFMIHKVMDIPPVQMGGMSIDLSITNSVLTMMVGAAIVIVFFLLTARRQLVPDRAQAVAEQLYGIIDSVLVGPIIGAKGRPYIPFIFSLFMLIMVLNLMGVLLAVGSLFGQTWTFTATAQLAVTATLALLTFLSCLVLGFVKNGPGFVKLFVPSDMPLPLLIFMVPIEMISYFARPLTLAMRLFGNMLGGHVVMSIFGSFVVALGIVGLAGGIATLGFLGSALSLGMIVALTGLELIVAFLQAFVFAALATVYINEVVNFGHGH